MMLIAPEPNPGPASPLPPRIDRPQRRHRAVARAERVGVPDGLHDEALAERHASGTAMPRASPAAVAEAMLSPLPWVLPVANRGPGSSVNVWPS